MKAFIAGFVACSALATIAELVLLTLGEHTPKRSGSLWPVVNLLAPIELSVQTAVALVWMSAALVYVCNPFLWLWVRQIRECADEDGIITLTNWQVRNVSVGMRGVRMEQVPPSNAGAWASDPVWEWYGRPLWKERRAALEVARKNAEARGQWGHG